MPGVEVQTVANALDIHPFMLSRWRKEVRNGVVKGRIRRGNLPSRSTRELKALQTLKGEHAILKAEHELLKKPSGSLPHEDGHLRIHRRPASMVEPETHVRAVWRQAVGLLCVARPRRECPAPAGPGTARQDPDDLRAQPRHLWQSAGAPSAGQRRRPGQP